MDHPSTTARSLQSNDLARGAVREWWPDMELVDDLGDDELQVGSTVSFRVH